MKPEPQTESRFRLQCKQCKKETIFEQPYPYHAGFSDQGFLYNDEGNLTLVWSMYDPTFCTLYPASSPLVFSAVDKKRFEKQLPQSPNGDRWRFVNSPRCPHCMSPIGAPMGDSIYYFIYPGSVLTDSNGVHALGNYLKKLADDKHSHS